MLNGGFSGVVNLLCRLCNAQGNPAVTGAPTGTGAPGSERNLFC